MSRFIYLQEQLIKIHDHDDEKEDRAEKEKVQETIDNYVLILLYQIPTNQSFDEVIY